jgi:hypothetical protein
MPNDQIKSPEQASADLRKASDALKAKIAEARQRNDMPLDEALGNPAWEQRAADGHLDRPEDDDEK